MALADIWMAVYSAIEGAGILIEKLDFEVKITSNYYKSKVETVKL